MYEMMVTLSGAEHGPVSFSGDNIVIEDDSIYVDGDIVAKRNDDGLWYFADEGYERAALRVIRPQFPVITFDTADSVRDIVGALKHYLAVIELEDGEEQDVVIVRPEAEIGPSAVRVRDYDPETGEKSDAERVVNVRRITVD